MPNKPTNDQIVQRLSSAFEPARTHHPSGAEFFAEVRAKGVSVWGTRTAALIGVAVLIAASVAIYHYTNSPSPSPAQPAARQILDDPGAGPTIMRLRELDSSELLPVPENAEPESALPAED